MTRTRQGGPTGADTQWPGSAVNRVIDRNIRTLVQLRSREMKDQGIESRSANIITRFSGSLAFVYVHAVWFGAWVAINVRWTPLRPFDPFPFSFLTMIVSLEAIFLSTFVLTSQNRMQRAADRRADLDLQVNLLTKHEVTRIIQIVDAVAERLGVSPADDPELRELKEDVPPRRGTAGTGAGRARSGRAPAHGRSVQGRVAIRLAVRPPRRRSRSAFGRPSSPCTTGSAPYAAESPRRRQT